MIIVTGGSSTVVITRWFLRWWCCNKFGDYGYDVGDGSTDGMMVVQVRMAVKMMVIVVMVMMV